MEKFVRSGYDGRLIVGCGETTEEVRAVFDASDAEEGRTTIYRSSGLWQCKGSPVEYGGPEYRLMGIPHRWHRIR